MAAGMAAAAAGSRDNEGFEHISLSDSESGQTNNDSGLTSNANNDVPDSENEDIGAMCKYPDTSPPKADDTDGSTAGAAAPEKKSMFSVFRWAGALRRTGADFNPDKPRASGGELTMLPGGVNDDARCRGKTYQKQLSLQTHRDWAWIQQFQDFVRTKDLLGKDRDLPAVHSAGHPRRKELQKCYTIDVLDQRFLPTPADSKKAGLREVTISPPPPSEVVSMVPTTHTPQFKHSKTVSRSNSNLSTWSASTLGIDRGACRICYTNSGLEQTIEVCHCVTFVHPSCLMKWLETADLDRCEVCRYKFTITKTMKPICQWSMPDSVKKMWMMHSFLVFFVVYTILYLWGMTKAVEHFFFNIQQGRTLETSGVLTLIVIGTILFILLLLKTGDVCMKIYQKWRLPNLALYLYVNGVKWRYQDLKF